MDELIRNIAVYAIPVVLAITAHETAHAYVARFFGDTTAFEAGRMTLNPLAHIDLFGTIFLPIVLYLSPIPLIFAYAKPLPVDVSRLHHPRRDAAWVALAGPSANLVMTLMWLAVAVALAALNIREAFPILVARAGVFVNALMFAFNLVPIPPLDGGHVVTSMLPDRVAVRLERLEPYSTLILLALLYFPMLDFWIKPIMRLVQKVVDHVAPATALFFR